jgi:RNA polymerase sigma-70 factor (ECF subfamily)
MNDEQTSTARGDLDELIVRAKCQRLALGQIYEHYYPEVYRYCARRLLVRTVAEDAVSDTFLQIAAHMRSFPGRTETDFRRWLFRIATNQINAWFRQTRRREALWNDAARDGRLNENRRQNAIDDQLDWPTVYSAILELDERDRAIVTLRFFSNCNFDEIADVVSSTPGAVRTALSRIIGRLREKFKVPIPPDMEPIPKTAGKSND